MKRRSIHEWIVSGSISENIVKQRGYIELVRCKDCRWHEREQPGMVYCPHIVGNWVEDDWYCAGGERREDEEEKN